MQEDRYGNRLTTTSAVARDAYVDGCDLILAQWHGGVAAFDRALAADPDFPLAHAGRARALQLASDMAGARAAISAAKAYPDVPERDASHIEVFNLMLNPPGDVLAQVHRHVARWPTDALVAATATNIAGLIGISGRVDREQEQVDFLNDLAPAYGNDWWFNGHYGMALSELGAHDRARPLIERSLADQPRNAGGAHAWAHYLYEVGDATTAVDFIGPWLTETGYPPGGTLYGHLNWHLALVHLGQGNVEEGLRLFDKTFGADDYRAPVFVKMLDAPAFLWRAELAGHPRDGERWRKVHDFARATFPNPGFSFVDWHVALSDAVRGDDNEPRIRQIEALIASGSYPAGTTVPTAARGFAAFERGDYPAAIAALESMLDERIRMAGSRAQLDLVEFTLLKAYLAAGRTEDARRMVSRRRSGPASIPVAEIEGLAAH